MLLFPVMVIEACSTIPALKMVRIVVSSVCVGGGDVKSSYDVMTVGLGCNGKFRMYFCSHMLKQHHFMEYFKNINEFIILIIMQSARIYVLLSVYKNSKAAPLSLLHTNEYGQWQK